MSESNLTLRRRSFLQALGLAALARACSSDGSGTRPSSGDAGIEGGGALDGGMDAASADASAADAPFGVWRAMRGALRASPDSLGDQAAKLVAATDAQGLFTFVRDNIVTLPPVTAAAEKSQRWGALGALRGGAGTPRERAELLALLLQRAGFKASVVMGDPDGDLRGSSGASTVYLRSVERSFEPGPPPPSIGSWVRALTGSDSGSAPEPLDPMGATAKSVFDAINALLPSTASANPGVLPLFSVPLVALDQGGTTKYLNPLSPKAVFGEPYATNIVPAPDPDPLPTVKASLLVARANDPQTQIPVVTATYTVDQLIGRELMIHTQPSGSLEALITSPLSNIVAFVPVIAVTGTDLSADDREKLTTAGAWITQAGDILDRAKDGTVSTNGLALGKGGDDAMAKDVATVSVTVNASAFPQIELSVSALDAKKKPVVGLSASAFAVSEDGNPVSFLMRDNGVTGPRVLFLVDTTGSQPPISSAWANAVAAALFKAAPDANVQVVTVGAAAPTSDGYSITDAASLVKTLTTLPGDAWQSYINGAILAAQKTTPTLIVILSDGDAQDPELESRTTIALSGSAPVLAVTSGKTTPVADSPIMDAFATGSGGQSVNGGDLSDPTLTTSPLSQMLQGRATAPYRFSYTAPTKGASTRKVTVSVSAKGSASYDVPAKPIPSGAVVGLYLSLTLTSPVVAGEETCTRVLGGWLDGADPNDIAAITAAAADARAAMLGSAQISFEGAPPTLSTWMADILEWRLATEPAAKALANGDVVGAFTALGDVPTMVPREAPALHAPAIPVADAVIYEESLRAVLFCTRAANPMYRADILPFTRLTTATASTTLDVFRTNLLASLRMAVAESAAFRSSTLSSLQGKDLELIPIGMVGVSDVPQVPEAQRLQYIDALNQYSNWFRFIAKDGSTLAFWAVHPHGSCLGVLPDGSGGGQNPCDSYKALANMLDLLSAFSDILGVPALSIWAELGKLVALAGVETLLAFNGTPVVVTPDQQFAALGCSIGSAMLGSFPASYTFKQEGVVTLATNFFVSASVSTVVGQFSVCGAYNNPCK